MRRIPRPLRAIDPSRPLTLPRRPQLWCAASPAGLAAGAAPARGFLVPAGKQDKKKHQQFVRRWQKRLLGDSEPIGAHVDPYDPTSPVRIAPEEQGEYEEVLDDAVEVRSRSHEAPYRREEHRYQPATSTHGLPRVGDSAWLRARREVDLAREYEKLTGRTYTPLSLDMANDIEGLTGTPYTLRNGNLLLAQTVHNVTGRPYTLYNFGLHRKPATSRELRQRFERAVTEVFALKQAGLNMDLSKLPNGGVYEAPRWVQDIKLYKTDSGELALAYPRHTSAAEFLSLLQAVPKLEESTTESSDLLVDEVEVEAEAEANLNAGAEPTGLSVSASSEEQLPTMDPATPAFKRAAMVKADTEKKFDFMSNRPVPRTKPLEQSLPIAEAKAEQPVVSAVTVEETAIVPPLPEQASSEPSPSASTQVESAQPFVAPTPQEVQTPGDAPHGPTSTTVKIDSGPELPPIEEVKWRSVRITNPALKFCLYKRIHQLTSLRISDPQLTATQTLGDLYGHLCAAAKPKPATLHSALFIEGQRAREQAKHQRSTGANTRQKANLGDLITLGNVEIRRARPNKAEKNTKTGLDKVVQYALSERGLRTPGHGLGRTVRRGTNSSQRSKSVAVGPDLGRIISSEGAKSLEKAS
ncbi:hypothetical protein NX059_006095 [Plenodomus lindquistii]|nr:hypothetical protein NX059_006095 [Plenodomus lindquistii]